MSSSTTSLRPSKAAKCNGVPPTLFFAFTSTPAAKCCLTASMSPPAIAAINVLSISAFPHPTKSTATIVVSRRCFICLQLLILQPSCRFDKALPESLCRCNSKLRFTYPNAFILIKPTQPLRRRGRDQHSQFRSGFSLVFLEFFHPGLRPVLCPLGFPQVFATINLLVCPDYLKHIRPCWSFFTSATERSGCPNRRDRLAWFRICGGPCLGPRFR